jgi:hypothetical protein
MSDVMIATNRYPDNPFGKVAEVQNGQAELPIPSWEDRLKPFQLPFKIGGVFTSRVEAFEKVAKNSHRVIDIASKMQWIVSTSLESLSSTLKSVVDVFDSIRLLGMLNLFLCPQKNHKYFLFDDKNSIYKKCDRLFLTGHLICKSARVLNKWRLIDLGEIAKAKIGQHLGVFHFITDNLMIGSCIFNILDTGDRLKECDKQNQTQAAKLKKWEARPEMLALVKAGNQSEIAHLQTYWEEKIEKKQKTLVSLQNQFSLQPSDKDQKTISLLKNSIDKLLARLQDVAQRNYEALHEKLSKTNQADKIRKWQFEGEKIGYERTCSWVKIAASVSKIFVIVMAFAFTAFHLTMLLPTLALLACGIISDSFGLAKIAMEQLAGDGS